MNNLDPKTNALVAAVYEAGASIKNSFLNGSVTHISTKLNKSDIVTNLDTESENIIVKCIRKYFPSVEIYSEELSRFKDISFENNNIAIIDPLDGTSNFSLGIPYFSISILIKEGSDLLAMIYNPVTELLFLNKNGNQKLFLQGNSLHIDNLLNKKTDYDLSNLVLAVVSDYTIPPQATEPFLQYLYYAGIKRVMSNWSPAHDYLNLILKRFDCVISLSEASFSEAAGLSLARSSQEHEVKFLIKKMYGLDFPITISAHKHCISAIINLIDKFET